MWIKTDRSEQRIRLILHYSWRLPYPTSQHSAYTWRGACKPPGSSLHAALSLSVLCPMNSSYLDLPGLPAHPVNSRRLLGSFRGLTLLHSLETQDSKFSLKHIHIYTLTQNFYIFCLDFFLLFLAGWWHSLVTQTVKDLPGMQKT